MIDPYQRYRDQRYFGSLNGVRFISIAAVLWHHSPALPTLTDPSVFLTRGFTGVDFFFVLSGFLITTLLLREEVRAGRISLVGFYRRRILRIIPVYYLVVTAVAAYYILWQGQAEYAPMLPYYYLFLANFLTGDIPLLAPTWSLSVEEQYYLLWPALLVFLSGAAMLRLRILLVLMAGCAFLAWGGGALLGLTPFETAQAVFRIPATSYLAILIGSLLAITLHSRRGFAMAQALLGRRLAPLGTGALMILALAMLPKDLSGPPFTLLHATMALFIASVVIREDHVLAPVLSWRPVARVGEISYGLYLYHLIGLHIANVALARMGLPPGATIWWVTITYPLISIVIAELSFRYFEAWFLHLKSRQSSSPPTPVRGES